MPTRLSTTRSRRVLLPLAVLVLAVAMVGLLLGVLATSPAAMAQMDPTSTDGLGSISGTVVGENRTPLAGMQVDFYIYGEIENSAVGWHGVRSASTDAAGHYMAALTPGIYRVRFSDPAGIYALQFYSDAVSAESAQDIVIAGTAKTGVDAQMQAAGSISGVLHAEDVLSPSVAKIAAYARVGEGWQLVQADYASDKSSYSLAGLPPGTYRVCLAELIAGSQTRPCYDRIAAGIDYATDIVIKGSEHIAGVDLWTSGFADYATIKGKVTNVEETGLAGIKVEALATEGTPYTFYTTTNEAGEYALGVVAPAEFAVEFTNRDGLYVSQTFSGPIPLLPAEVRSGINVSLTLGGLINGTWGFDSGLPHLVAIDVEDFDLQYETANSYTFPYQIGGLPAGVYRVCDRTWAGYVPQYVYRCYPDRTPYATATNITVTAGSTVSGINYPTLAPQPPTEGAVVTGVVRGPDGRLLAGIDVNLLQLWTDANGYSTESSSGYEAHNMTGVDGIFRFEGVENGLYNARAYDPAGVYATTYYQSTPSWGYGDSIVVEHDQSPAPVEIKLPYGGALTGWVQGAGGQRISDAYVTLYNVHGDLTALNEYWPVDGSGRFAVTGLWPGVYLVCANSDRWPFAQPRCYSTPPEPYLNVTQPVTVTVGVTVENIGITLGPIPTRPVYLPAIKR